MEPDDHTEAAFARRVAALAAADIHTFYRQALLQRAGLTIDTRRPYSDVTAEVLLQRPELLQAIGQGLKIRQRSFRLPRHDGTAAIGNRLARYGAPQGQEALVPMSEKLLARALYNLGQIAGLGRIVDYEVPLQEQRSDRLGDVDLVATAGPLVKLIELKIAGGPSRGESLLRALLEAYTYCRLLSGALDRFVRDYADRLEPSPDADYHFQPVVLVPIDSAAGDTVRRLGRPEYSCLRALILHLDSRLPAPFEFCLFTYASRQVMYPATRRPETFGRFEVVRSIHVSDSEATAGSA